MVTVTNEYAPTGLVLFQPQRRRTAATEKNATITRSDGVGIITIGAEQFDSDSEQDPYGPRPGVLYVIDLAGSERSADSAKHSKERTDETIAVNLSLMSLKAVSYTHTTLPTCHSVYILVLPVSLQTNIP